MGENGRSQYRNRSGRPSRVGRSDSSQPIVDVDAVLAQDRKREAAAVLENTPMPVSEFALAKFLERDCESHEELDKYLSDISGIRYFGKDGVQFMHINLVLDNLKRIRNSNITVDNSSFPESIKNTLINFLRRLEQREQNNSFNNNDNNMSVDRPTNPPEVEAASAPETPLESPAEVAEEISENIDQAAEEVARAVPEAAPEIKKLVDDSQNEIQDVLDEETGKMVKVSKAKASPDANYHFVDVLDEETGKMVKVLKPNSEIDEVLDEETGRMIKFGQTKTETSPSLKNDKDDIDKLLTESEKAVEQDPYLKEASRRLDRSVPEEQSTESNQVLEKSRGDFWTALRQRGNVWSKGRNLLIGTQKKETLGDFEKIRAEYNNGLAVERDAQMKSFVESLDASLKPEEKNAQITKKYIELLQAEEKEVDKISSSQEVNLKTKFKTWWHKTARIRMFLGVGAILTSATLTAGATVGLAAGFVATRGVLSGAGTYVTVEGALDTRTEKLGQKGLIDDLKNIGFKFGEKGKVSAADKEYVLERLEDKDKYPLEVLEKEYSRLRDLSLDKSSNLVDAGRFGAEQALLVQAIVETYHLRKAEQFVELTQAKGEEQAKATMLASFLQQEDNATKTATSEQDLSRMKAIKRNLAAGALGLTMGLVAGSSAWDKVSPENTTTVDPGPGAVDPSPEAVVPVVETTVAKGDTVWGLVENHLKAEVPDWDKLNEAEQTRFIDYLENKVTTNPSHFGIIDPDHLQAGTKINWGDLFADKNLEEAMKFVKTLTPEQMQSIVENNKILSEAAKNGVEITSKNVDTIIKDIRVHGLEQYLAEHGHAVAKAAVENVQDIATGVETDTASDIVDAVTEATSEAADNSGAESLADMGAGDKIYNFVHDQGPYDANLLKIAQRMGELSSQHGDVVDQVVNKVFESSAEVQQQFLHDLSPTDFTADNNKGTVFLELLKQTDVQLSEINTIDQLKDLLSRFDSFAHSGTLPTSDAFEPRLLNLGSQDGNVYAFVKKASGKFLGLFGEKKYLIDDGNQLVKVGEKVMSTFLQTNKTI